MRHESIKPLSREHHFGLVLCSKLRKGMNRNVSTKRMEVYCKWFFKNHLDLHFEEEESYVFPILGEEHAHIVKAIEQHKKLSELFNKPVYSKKTLTGIVETLESHIRFEERFLFDEVQKKANKVQLLEIEKNLNDKVFTDNTLDEFWK